MGYLSRFREQLEKKWKGSLVSVSEARSLEVNAKEYLRQLLREGQVEKVTWGWFWVPDAYQDFFDFLAQDKHFKVLQKQTAAAVWNGDFVHREHYSIAVKDRSYGRALEAFAKLQGWNVSVETRDFKKGQYTKIGGLYVEALEDAIVDCLKEWAFVDAFACLYENYDSVAWSRISRRHWERIPRTNARVGQVLKYGTAVIGKESGSDAHPATRADIPDSFIRRQVEEAAQKVAELG